MKPYRRLVALVLVGMPAFVGPPAAAQAPPERGETVRLVVTHPTLRSTETVTGTFDELGRDSLYLAEGTYRRSLVRRIEVARGTRSYMVGGAAAGGALGGLIGTTLGATTDQADIPQQGEEAQWWVSGLIGTGVGIVIGGLLGSRFRRTRWVSVSLDVQLGAAPVGTAGFGVAWGWHR